jgi:hypothetical protein
MDEVKKAKVAFSADYLKVYVDETKIRHDDRGVFIEVPFVEYGLPGMEVEAIAQSLRAQGIDIMADTIGDLINVHVQTNATAQWLAENFVK